MRDRIEYQLIESCIPYQAKVLDLGCSDGSLLQYLVERKEITARGIEMDLQGVKGAIKKKSPSITAISKRA